MLGSSANAKLLLEGHEYTYAWRIEIDLPGGILASATLQASAVEIEASVTTDQPDGTRLEEGYAAQQATFTLAGQYNPADATKTAGWLFNRYSSGSPLYRSDAFMCPVRIYFQLYTPGCQGVPETFRKFTGFVEDYTVSDDGSQVEFTCIDGRQLLRSVPAVPVVITDPPYNAGLTSEFAIDALLRAATNGAVSSWPAQPAGCILSVGYRASIAPEIGTLNAVFAGQTADSPMFGAGTYGTAYLGQSTGSGYRTYNCAGAIGRSLFITGVLTAASPLAGGASTALIVSGGGGDYLSLNYNGSAVEFDIFGTVGVFFSTSAQHVTVELALTLPTQGGSTVTGTLWVNGQATAINVTTSNARGGYPWAAPTAWSVVSQSQAGIAVEAFQVATTLPAASRYPFTPTAVIDPSLNTLQVIPSMSGDPWQTIQDIAEAELGVARFDESTGRFVFQNRQTIAATPVARTVAATSSLASIGGIESTFASVVNDATVGFTTYKFTSANGVPKLGRLWEAPDAQRVKAHGSTSFAVTLDSYSAANLDSTFSVLPNGSTDTTNSYYRASVDQAGSATFTGGLTFTVTQTSASDFTIVVSNPYKQDAWLVSSADYTDEPVGTPLLWLAGQVITQNNEQTVNIQSPPQVFDPAGNAVSGGAATSRFGDIAWSNTGSAWIQNAACALDLAVDVVVSNCLPLPNFTGLTVVPDPRIQLSDKLLVDDTPRSGVVEYVQCFGYTITWQAGQGDDGDSFTMSLDGRVIAPPGGGVIGWGTQTFADRGVIGVGSTPGSLYIYST